MMTLGVRRTIQLTIVTEGFGNFMDFKLYFSIEDGLSQVTQKYYFTTKVESVVPVICISLAFIFTLFYLVVFLLLHIWEHYVANTQDISTYTG